MRVFVPAGDGIANEADVCSLISAKRLELKCLQMFKSIYEKKLKILFITNFWIFLLKYKYLIAFNN